MATADDDDRGEAPLTLGEGRFSGDRLARPWTWRRSLLLRALAAVELVKGLGHWAMLIGAGGAAEPMAGQSAGWFLAQGFFAVFDPVAAVGMWVGATWGVAIWLIAALGQLAVSALDGPTAIGLLVMSAVAIAMAAYAFLSAKARREET